MAGIGSFSQTTEKLSYPAPVPINHCLAVVNFFTTEANVALIPLLPLLQYKSRLLNIISSIDFLLIRYHKEGARDDKQPVAIFYRA